MVNASPSVIQYRPPRGFHFQWHVTDRCNLRCRHCYMDDGAAKAEMSFAAVKDILHQYYALVSDWGISARRNKISLTGGEPLVRPDIFDILAECYKNRGIATYGLLSNGIFLTEKNVARLKSLNVTYVQVSIEGIGRTNDDIRGKGSFKKAVEGLRRTAEAGISAHLSMTVHRGNLKDVPAMIALAKKLNAGVIGLRRLVPFGRGKALRQLLLSPYQTRRLSEYVIAASRRSRHMRITLGCEDGIASQEMHYSSHGCRTGLHCIVLLPDGTVLPCRRLPIPVGDLTKERLADVFRKASFWETMTQINAVNDECLGCPFFNECRGGAQCISYAYWGRLGGGDPQCWRRYDRLPGSSARWEISPKARTIAVRNF